MEFDVTTKEQALNILKAQGYSEIEEVKQLKPHPAKNAPKDLVKLSEELIKKYTALRVIISREPREVMGFHFDEDQKLVSFSAQGLNENVKPLIAGVEKEFETVDLWKEKMGGVGKIRIKPDSSTETFIELDDGKTSFYTIASPKRSKLVTKKVKNADQNIVTAKSLGIEVGVTKKKQVIDIIKKNGYFVVMDVPDIAGFYQQLLQNFPTFLNQLPLDKVKGMSALVVISIDGKKCIMMFAFGRDQILDAVVEGTAGEIPTIKYSMRFMISNPKL